MEEQKTYSINGREFKLKKSLTLREHEITGKVLRTFKLNGYHLFGTITLLEACKFFGAILTPVNQEQVNADFFLDIDEKLANEILEDFFLSRIEQLQRLTEKWEEYDKHLKILRKNSSL
jgi:hypothetical protein